MFRGVSHEKLCVSFTLSLFFAGSLNALSPLKSKTPTLLTQRQGWIESGCSGSDIWIVDNWGSKILGPLAKKTSKRPQKDQKNWLTGPNFENHESDHG